MEQNELNYEEPTEKSNIEDDWIPISALQAYSYCPASCYYMLISCEFAENAYTVAGELAHQRVHSGEESICDDVPQHRAVRIFSFSHRISGVADLVEEKAGIFYPVEYKVGHQTPWKRGHIQLCAQALCLEEIQNTSIPYGYMFYAANRRRQQVIFDEMLRTQTITIITQVKQLYQQAQKPNSHYSTKCQGCSLYNICLPKETEMIQKYFLKLPNT